MAVEYVRRGEIYKVRLDTGIGSEQGVTRPALVISSDEGNRASPLVIVAYLTTKDHNIGIHYGPTKATGIPSYVQCEQIYTVSKQRLIHLMGQLSQNEMTEVESRLDEVLDLGYIDDTPLKEKEAECASLRAELEEMKSKNAELEKKISGHADELIDRDIEVAVAKRMYNKAVSIIAAMRSEGDLPQKPTEQPKEEKPKESELPGKLVDINTAKFSVLRGLGLSNNMVLNVTNYRPYKRVEDLKKVPGMNSRLYGIIERKICCVPVKAEEQPKAEPVAAEKVNINTASAQELCDKLGLSKTVCFSITGTRKRNGPYKAVEDLLNVPKFTKNHFERYWDKVEV